MENKIENWVPFWANSASYNKPKLYFGEHDIINAGRKLGMNIDIVMKGRKEISFTDIVWNKNLLLKHRALFVFDNVNRKSWLFGGWEGIYKLARRIVRSFVERDTSFLDSYEKIIIVDGDVDSYNPDWFNDERCKITRLLYDLKKDRSKGHCMFIDACVELAPEIVEDFLLKLGEHVNEFLKENERNKRND